MRPLAPHSPSPSPPCVDRILLIDAYDSFTHNLSTLLSRETRAEIHTIHIDAPFATLSSLLPFLSSFSAIVVGPGPGSPLNARDVGIVDEIWQLAEEHLLPVFGVCLGLQSLCAAFGARVERMGVVKHGLPATIMHTGDDLFAGVEEVEAVRYHSLHVVMTEAAQKFLREEAWTDDENGRVLMAARHYEKPFWGVQYHPESICTEGGEKIVRNWWRMAKEWNESRGRCVQPLAPEWKSRPREKCLLEQMAALRYPETNERIRKKVQTRELTARGLSATRICEALGVRSSEDFVLLDSAAEPGRWSIIGIVTPGATRLISYTTGDSHATISIAPGRSGQSTTINLQDFDGSIWRFLAAFMDSQQYTDGTPESPFWGGLIGYFSYELGVTSLSIPLLSRQGSSQKDVNLAFIERSIAIDTYTGRVYIQSLHDADDAWLLSTKHRLQQEYALSITPAGTPPPASPRLAAKVNAKISQPDKEAYKNLVRRCQSYLHSGDSYELCLTSRHTVTLPLPSPPAWDLYTSLRLRNPAPYAAFLKLAGTTLLSSSPERFLSYSRTGAVQLRPIKGTFKKTRLTTLASAREILSSPKERAENLMIVDLIRHDLHRILGENVKVDQLMQVEEYKTVYQLVSVISGQISSSLKEAGVTGFDVLAASLPPGSMTGAPKKRSVEILQTLEKGQERGVYSGVVGYWDVGGGGDWSVVIRSAFREDADEEGVWGVGAGGAVTALSEPEGEWEEMMVKAVSTIGGLVAGCAGKVG